MNVSMTVNGEQVSHDVEPRQLLVHFLRETLDLTGTHWGCDTSNCGACVVLLDGEPVKSCTILAAMAAGHEVRTVESLEVDGKLGIFQAKVRGQLYGQPLELAIRGTADQTLRHRARRRSPGPRW